MIPVWPFAEELNSYDDRNFYVRTKAAAGSNPGDINGRGLHSFTFELNLSRVCHIKAPYTPLASPYTPSTRATQALRAPPIPYTSLKLSSEANECKPLINGEAGCREYTLKVGPRVWQILHASHVIGCHLTQGMRVLRAHQSRRRGLQPR